MNAHNKGIIMNDINSYPFNRIILDIVELLQDLRLEDMPSIFALNGSGSADITLFVNDTLFKNWVDGMKVSDENPIMFSAYISAGDCNAAHMAWNELIKCKEADEFDLEAILSKAEYEEQR